MKLDTIIWLFNVKYVLEIFYYIAGIVVCGSIFISLLSYLLSKKDMKVRYSREINSITSDQLKNFYIKILPMYEKLKNIENELFFFDEKINLVKLDDEDIKKSAKNYYSNLSKKADYEKIAKELLINIQILSSNFQFGVADIELAKKIILDKYLNIFEAIFPIILQENDVKLYQSCVDLYNKWRIERKTIKNQKESEALHNAAKGISEFELIR